MHTCMYVCMYILFSQFFSIIVCFNILNIVPCATEKILVVYFICGNMHLLTPYTQFMPPTLPFGNRKFGFCDCELVSVF